MHVKVSHRIDLMMPEASQWTGTIPSHPLDYSDVRKPKLLDSRLYPVVHQARWRRAVSASSPLSLENAMPLLLGDFNVCAAASGGIRLFLP